MPEKPMTNLRAIAALENLKMYANAHSLDAVNYAIAVLEKLEECGIQKPLEELSVRRSEDGTTR